MIAIIVVNLCVGIMYSWSVFSGPKAVELSAVLGREITSADMAIVFSVANMLGPITMISGGVVNDKVGPKGILILGGVMMGAGLVLSGFAKSIAVLMLGFSILSALGMSFIYGSNISNAVKFFPDKRGFAGGIATASYGLSSVLLPPIANILIENVGIKSTFCIVGVFITAVVVIASFLIIQCPLDFVPEGFIEKSGSAGTKETVNKTWRQMISDPLFYVLLILMMCGASAGMMVISQASTISVNMVGMSTGSAAIMVSVLALFNSGGRLGAGVLSDKIGRLNVLLISLVIGIFGLLSLAFIADTTLIFAAGICMVGICFGSIMGIYPSITADSFGPKNNSVNYGFVFIGFAIAGYVGPQIMRKLASPEIGYKTAFLVASGLCAFGIIIWFVCKSMMKKR